MTLGNLSARTVFAERNADGTLRQPVMSEAQLLLMGFEQLVSAVTRASPIFNTRAELDASLNFDPGVTARVIADALPFSNRLYRKIGGSAASGGGGWEPLDIAPEQIVPLTVTSGTGDSFVALGRSYVPDGIGNVIYLLTVAAANTGPVTVSVNNAAFEPLLTATGRPLPANYLRPGSVIMMTRSATGYLAMNGMDDTSLLPAGQNLLDQMQDVADSVVISAANNIGRLGLPWNANDTFPANTRVHDEGQLYRATVTNTNTKPRDNPAVYELLMISDGGVFTESLTLATSTLTKAPLIWRDGAVPVPPIDGAMGRDGDGLFFQDSQNVTHNIVLSGVPDSFPAETIVQDKIIASVVAPLVFDDTNIIPGDNTVPEDDEGGLVMSGGFTPLNAANKLRIHVSVPFDSDAFGNFAVSVFDGSTCVGANADNGTGARTIEVLCTDFVAGVTSEKTITARIGNLFPSGANLEVAKYFGTLQAAQIRVMEVKA